MFEICPRIDQRYGMCRMVSATRRPIVMRYCQLVVFQVNIFTARSFFLQIFTAGKEGYEEDGARIG